MLDGYPKLVAIDEEPDHEIVHGRRLGKADRATYEPFNPRPQIEVFTVDFLRIGLAHFVLRRVNMALVGTPPIGVEAVDPKRLEQLFELQKDGILPPPKDVPSHGPTGVIDGMPQPPRRRFLADITPHFIAL
jgi:hypothetical protein